MADCLVLVNCKAGALEARAFRENLRRWLLGRLAGRASRPASLEHLAAIERACVTAGLRAVVEPIPPWQRLAARLESARAQGIGVVVAAGGDGTVRSVAQKLVGTELLFGVVPVGTANNFARSLGLPRDLVEALRVVAAGHTQAVDVGRIGEEYFLEAAGVGLFADAIHAFGAEEARRYQIGRVLKTLLPLLLRLRVSRLRITLDGATLDETCVMLTVANETYLGEGLSVAPGARLDDNRFDVVVVGALSHLELIRFALDLLRGRGSERPKIQRYQARTVEVRHHGRGGLAVHADDHIVGRTPVRLESVPAALRVFTPLASGASLPQPVLSPIGEAP